MRLPPAPGGPRRSLTSPPLPSPLHVVTAPRLEPLFEHLAAEMERAPLPPLEREVIVVAQNTGLRDWVEQGLARRLGCAASLWVVSPRGLSTELARRWVPIERPTAPDGRTVPRDPFEREALLWRLADLLPQLPRRAPYDEVHAYLDKAVPDGPLLLGVQLASLFDDYQVYRPDVLAAWERGDNPLPEHPHAPWQAGVWRRLRAGAPTTPRAEHFERLIQYLDRRTAPPPACPRRVTVFGATVVQPLYLRVLHALARHTAVTYLAVDHTQDAEDAGRANLLVADLGAEGRELAAMLEALPAPAPTVTRLEAPPPPRDSLLHVIQADVQEGVARGAAGGPAAVPFDQDDCSLRVHDTHSPLRELEVLRDQLLDAVEHLDGLRPDDILVLVPDLATYAPVVDAVFGASGDDEPPLPYHVDRHPLSPAWRVLDAFKRVLGLPGGRVSSAEMLELLDEPVFRRAAGLQAEDGAVFRDWAARTGVRWGSNGQHKALFGLPDDDVHTWQHGLDRLMLGYAVGEAADLVDGRAPLIGVEDPDLLGRFAEWTACLFGHVDGWSQPRTLRQWAAAFDAAIEDLLLPRDDEEQEAVRFLREQAHELVHLHHLAPPGVEVPFGAVRTQLVGAIETFEVHRAALTGRMTVAHPFRLRHAPFRVVAFIGLNDGTFPPGYEPDPISIVTDAPRPGDFDPRRTGRQLFLDALMAARDRVILSFVGRSERDNSARAPSPVLEALLDVGDASFTAADGRPARDHLVVRHRLQPFSRAYFRRDEDPRLFSYAARHRVQRAAPGEPQDPPPFLILPANGEAAPGPTIEPALPEGAVAATELAEAWAHPSRYFCRRRLGLYLEAADDGMEDEEPLGIDGLEAYALKEAILDGFKLGQSDAEIEARLRARGSLPPGELGAAWFALLRSAVEPQAERLLAAPGGQALDVVVEGDGWRLTARLPHVTPDQSLILRCARVKEKTKPSVEAWAQHLALNAYALSRPEGGVPRVTVLAGEDAAFRFAPVPEPLPLLGNLVRGWRKIRQGPPPLFEHASRTYAEKVRRGSEPQALDAARRQFNDAFGTKSDWDDPYVRLCFRGRDAEGLFTDQFARTARYLWEPILQFRHEA